MRRYTPDDEERIRSQAHVRAWSRAGLLDAAVAARLNEELRPDLRRTNDLLRAGLALFTFIIVIAAVVLVVTTSSSWKSGDVAPIAGGAAIACLAIAEALVARFRLYRFGVEEALAVSGAGLAALCAATTVDVVRGGQSGHAPAIAAFTVAAAGGFWVYKRFGLAYAAIGAMLCAAAIAFELDVSDSAARSMAAAFLLSAFALARARRLSAEREFLADECATIQAAAWIAAYLIMNLHVADFVGPLILPAPVGPWFYWATYAAIWLMPPIGLALGARQRDRDLVDANILLALGTLVTNKPYLGWPRHTWDPMLLGILLMAVALGVRRWLAAGEGGARSGFTALPLLSGDKDVVAAIGIASATFRPAAPAGPPPPESGFNGGRSGGGGAGAGF